jgi:hypothetical protein
VASLLKVAGVSASGEWLAWCCGCCCCCGEAPNSETCFSVVSKRSACVNFEKVAHKEILTQLPDPKLQHLVLARKLGGLGLVESRIVARPTQQEVLGQRA